MCVALIERDETESVMPIVSKLGELQNVASFVHDSDANFSRFILNDCGHDAAISRYPIIVVDASCALRCYVDAFLSLSDDALRSLALRRQFVRVPALCPSATRSLLKCKARHVFFFLLLRYGFCCTARLFS